MTKITQKQLIESLSQLKEIKPRKEWAVLLKSQILAEKQAEVVETKIAEQPAKSVGFKELIYSVFYQRKLAYAFATMLLLIAGVFGFARYTMPGDLLFPVKKIAEQSGAALTGQPNLAATLNSRINDLAAVAKEGRTDNIPSAISEINLNAKDLAQSLKNNTVNNPQTLKEIASSLKTLADVPGTDLSENKDVKDLYQTVVQSQIADLQKTTLTDDQKKTLTEIEDLYSQGKYMDALEKILLISK